MTSGTEVVIVIILVWKEFVQDVMFTVSNTVKQCVIGILHELYCRRPDYTGYSPARTPRRTTASMRCRSSAEVKPHQTLAAYRSLATTTDL